MEEERTIPSSIWVLSVIAGGLILVSGAVCIVLAFILPDLQESGFAVILVGVGIIALTLGAGLTAASLSGRKRLPSLRLYFKWGWAVCLTLTVALILIAVFVPADWHNHPLFAALHLGLAALPAFFLLSLMTLTAGHRRTLTLRQLIAMAAGGTGAVAIALPVELVGLVLSGVTVGIVAYLLPGGAVEVERLIDLFERWSTMPPTQIEEVFGIIASPVVLAVLALTLAVIAPLIEEFGKTLVMGVMGIWRRPGLTRAFLWGAACGLGFAVVESVTNGANGLGEVLGWLGGMGSRALATSMHMLTSGVIGLGWGLFWRKRRWMLPLAYIGAVAFHGLWNLNVIAIIGGMGIGMQSSPAGFALSIAGAGLQVVLMLFTPLALIGIPMLLRRYEEKSALAPTESAQ